MIRAAGINVVLPIGDEAAAIGEDVEAIGVVDGTDAHGLDGRILARVEGGVPAFPRAAVGGCTWGEDNVAVALEDVFGYVAVVHARGGAADGAVLGARVAVFVGGAGLDLGRGRGYEFCCGPSGWGDGCDAGELAAHGALAFWFQACEDAVGGVSSVGVISAVIPSRFSWRGTRRSGLLSSARRMLGRGFDQARGSIRWSLGG